MKMTAKIEFRGYEEKVSAKGNPYTVVNFEDSSTGQASSCMCSPEFNPKVHKKGEVFNGVFDVVMGKYPRMTLLSSQSSASVTSSLHRN